MTGVGAECRRLRLSPPLFTAFEASSRLSIAALYQDTRSLTHYPIRQITNLATLPTSFAISATMQKRDAALLDDAAGEKTKVSQEPGENEAIDDAPGAAHAHK